MPDLPIVGGSNNTWGTELNTWLQYDHLSTGEHQPRVVMFYRPIDGTTNNGDVVYWDSTSSSFKPALADGTDKQKALGMVLSKDSTAVVLFGVCDTTAAVTTNSTYYLSPTLAGRVTAVKPYSNRVVIGTGYDSSYLILNIKEENLTDTSSYSPTRAFDTNYQPDTSSSVIVNISFDATVTASGGVAKIVAKSDTATTPATRVATVGLSGGVNPDSTSSFHASFIVDKGDYYRVEKTEINGTVTAIDWVETALKE